MSENNSVSICIPTYNRADFLDHSLEVHIPIVREYNIEIYVFDNASTDNTSEVVQKWQKEYKHLKYYKHLHNTGPKFNLVFSLKYLKTDYIWLLADTYQFRKENVQILMNRINTTNEIDVLVFNLGNAIKIPSKIYKDKNKLLYDLGALMTCGAVNIVNIKALKDVYIDRYSMTYFPHTGDIFEYLSTKTIIHVEWIENISIKNLEKPGRIKTNWSHTPKVFEIGCEDWTNVVMSLPPSYKLENKMKCIMDFGKVSGLFLFDNILRLRVNGLLDYKIFQKYKFYFPFTINYNIWVILIISILPIFLVKNILFSKRIFNKFKMYFNKYLKGSK
jgi:glycosyltransferase involved in cell wall biosynthesis